MAAVNEGFGLSIVEAYSRGVPVVMPNGIDAFDDVFDSHAAVVATEYTPECFAKAIATALVKDWDKESILEIGKVFSMANCAEKYISVLSESAEKKRCSFNVGAVVSEARKAGKIKF